MELEQSFVLGAPPQAAWPAFHDFEALAACLPGATVTGPMGEDGAWPLRFDVKLGPIAAAFAGSGRLTLDEATRSGRFEGSATDKRSPSRVKGAAAFALHEEGAGCRVDVRVDYTLTGPLAQFSRGGLVRELAAALTAQFASRLQLRLQGTAPATVPAPVDVADAPARPTATATTVTASTATTTSTLPSTSPSPSPPPPTTVTMADPPALGVGAGPADPPRPKPDPWPVPARPAAQASAPLALDAGSLLRGVLAARWRRLLAWLTGGARR